MGGDAAVGQGQVLGLGAGLSPAGPEGPAVTQEGRYATLSRLPHAVTLPAPFMCVALLSMCLLQAHKLMTVRRALCLSTLSARAEIQCWPSLVRWRLT